MSSLPRRMQRKFARQSPDYEPAAQPTIYRKDGGYKTLTPTKGWRVFSARRLESQIGMAKLLEHDIPQRRKKPRKEYLRPAPPAPETMTRQRQRWERRKGVAA